MGEPLAFYAPLKSPWHPVPSGDRRMARALIDLLGRRGCQVELASRFRSFDRDGDGDRQRRIERIGGRLAGRLLAGYQRKERSLRPRAWITYHAYHKSPDWIGPVVSRALGIPYLLIETSFARKQAGGPWDLGHRATMHAIRAADITLALTSVDHAGLAPLIDKPAELRRLPPFIDPKIFKQASLARNQHRSALAQRFDLDPAQPWILAVGMMRDDVKRQSYERLAEALSKIVDRSWQLLIIGDGPARSEVEKSIFSLGSGRVRMAGILDEKELPACYAAADVYAWPAIREAYGLALLEAQASGLPVIAGRDGGVADVVQDNRTGLLTPPGDMMAFARAVAGLLDDPSKRRSMSNAAKLFVECERNADQASGILDRALHAAAAIASARTSRLSMPGRARE
ncbi:MAG: glycosyltransferase family 4 protein [Geminicoccaceae bacterium]